MIASILDTDLYKLTMQQAIFYQMPNNVEVEYKFICRNGIDFFKLDTIDSIRRAIEDLALLKLTPDEEEYLRRIKYFKSDYISFLKKFRFDPDLVHIKEIDRQFELRIIGKWIDTILFEVPILAIISELTSSKLLDTYQAHNSALKNLQAKFDLLNKGNRTFSFAEFGTRRRYSYAWQLYLIDQFSSVASHLAGTSNVYLAKKFKLRPIGTMAHEWIQAHQALYPLNDHQTMALSNWAQVYRGDLSIALTDTIGIDAFLIDFDIYHSKLFGGVRHDSGDPVYFTHKIIEHYKHLGIDPSTKTIVFSDGLTIPKAIELNTEIRRRWGDECPKLSFGIGTSLTNDHGFEPPNIVIKMVRCNGKPVAKISDAPGKSVCEDEAYINQLKKLFVVELKTGL